MRIHSQTIKFTIFCILLFIVWYISVDNILNELLNKKRNKKSVRNNKLI